MNGHKENPSLTEEGGTRKACNRVGEKSKQLDMIDTKKKLKLDELEVQSFVTSFSKEEGATQHILGGDPSSNNQTDDTCHKHGGDCDTGPTFWACHNQ